MARRRAQARVRYRQSWAAGGHGLATAYYLARNHGLRNVAVLEKGPLGLGNTGRNTTVVRSNYLWDDSAHLYEHALKLWENLSQELNFNTMFSQRGVVNIAFTRHELEEMERRAAAMHLNGIDCELLTPRDVKRWAPAAQHGCGLPLSGARRDRSETRRQCTP
jgi:sarcosine oxidase subunit beta